MTRTFLISLASSLLICSSSYAQNFVDLGGPASGFIGVSNFKNSSSQDGIENKNDQTNGLPDYANYQMANGNWTAIIASPQSTASDYAAFGAFSTGTFNDDPIVVNNQTITQSDFSTLSAGHIEYTNSLLTGFGSETIGVNNLTFDLNTYNHDGFSEEDSPFISNFSPLYTEYNDGGGQGNASLYYSLSLSNLSGTGLTFQDGVLDSMDISGDLTVQATSSINAALTKAFTGTFNTSGLGYTFSVNQQQSFPFVFTDVNMIMNRAGTAAVIPEMSTWVLMSICLGILALPRTINSFRKK